MKSIFVAFLASARILVAAVPSLHDGLSDRVAARQAQGLTWAQPEYCSTAAAGTGVFHTIYSLLQHPPAPKTYDYSSLCSAVVQSTTVVWKDVTASDTKTETRTSTTTTSHSATTTDNSPGTTTALCPTPSPAMQCAIPAYGYLDYLVNSDFIPRADCQQWCLRTPSCLSFQIIPQDNGIIKFDRCNIYNVSVIGNVDPEPASPATFYDRDCGDLSPKGCTAPAAPTITTAPSLASAIAANAVQKRDYTVPDFLSTLNMIFLPAACSCLISKAPAPVTLTQTNLFQSWAYVTVTSTRSELYSYTDHPQWKTIYTSVA
ncbi:hypothetical protein EG329_012722 [Mollisiaceae sp. DMI_Dod_QoI]|nr:hypothetical protein EG329_012722 [Helotiales sp. DMI_Dod_QoI]